MDTLRVRIPGATDAALQLELWAVVNEFTIKTNIWQQDISLTAVPGVTEYEIFPDGICDIVRLMGVVDANGLNIKASMPVPGTLELFDTPNQSATYTVTVALSASGASTRSDNPYIPDWIWTRYLDTFVDGVQGRMFSQIAKPYSNERLATFHMRKFLVGISRARNETNRENIYSAQRWRYPRSFAVRRR